MLSISSFARSACNILFQYHHYLYLFQSDWADVELPISLNPMDFPDSMRIIESPDVGRGRDRGIVNESYDVESDEFDDLIFALKTEEEKRTPSPRPVSADQPQIRRIKIADTHL